MPAKMLWPEEVACPDLETIFDDDPRLTDYSNYPRGRLPATVSLKRTNLTQALKKARERGRLKGVDPKELPVIVDLCGSKVQMGWGISPCLIKSRGACFGFWSPQHGRPLSISELCRLQG